MRVLLSVPPYVGFRAAELAELSPKPGAILLLCPTRDDSSFALSSVVVQRRAPWARVFVDASDPVSPLAVGWAAVSRTGATSASAGAALRAALPSPDVLPHELSTWLRVWPPNLTTVTRGLLEQVILEDHALRAENRRPSERAVNNRLQVEGLPSLRWWRGAYRCLKGMVGLQREPEANLISGAIEAGYSESAAFSRACLTYLDSPPSSLRDLLGWEWILWSALKRRL